jgi:hypothetical protein
MHVVSQLLCVIHFRYPRPRGARLAVNLISSKVGALRFPLQSKRKQG